jgi:hypothetical protein
MSTRAANKTELAPLYQDNELLHTIILPHEDALALKDQILRDSAFLADLNLMDYSLLVGVHRERFTLRFFISVLLLSFKSLFFSS